MSNIPKPELERGNFIAYTDEPNTIVSGSGGGGGAVFLEADYVGIDAPLTPKFSFNDVKNALDSGQAVFVKWTALGEDGQVNIVYCSVQALSYNETPGDEAYSVIAESQGNVLIFKATDPNATMTDSTA